MITDGYFRDGPLYVFGEVHINDGPRTKLSRDFPEKRYSLKQVIPGQLHQFEDEFAVRGGVARCRIPVWEKGTVSP